MKTPEEYLQEQILLPGQEHEHSMSSHESEFLRSFLDQAQVGAAGEEPGQGQESLDPEPALEREVPEPEEDPESRSPQQAGHLRQSSAGHVSWSDTEAEGGFQDAHQFVGCRVCGQEYALPLGEVQEVLRRIEPTRLPSHPPYLAGVINLRSTLVPLLCLDQLLEKSGSDRKTHQFIIVCRSGVHQFGLLVDKITTMHTFSGHDVEWSIDAQLGGDSGFLSGLIKSRAQLIGIVSVKRIAEQVLIPLQG